MKTLLTIFALTVFVGLGLGLGQKSAQAGIMEASDSPSDQVLDSDGSTVTFNSAYCEVIVGDTANVMLTGNGGDSDSVTVTGCNVRSNKATPKNHSNRQCAATCTGTGDRDIDVTLESASGGWKVCHVDLILSNGETLGFNFVRNPCDL